MPVESWMKPEDVPTLAAEATARIDAVLARLPEADRAAFWSSIRKCYNTPYNDPKPRALPVRDVKEATATRPHVGTSLRELPLTDALVVPPDVALGALLAVPAFGSEAHPV